jgi:hypothetical protein
MAVGDAGGYGGSTFTAQWNGASWTGRAAAPTSTKSGLWSLACWSGTGCVAVGGFPFGSGALAERWNGKSWSQQSVPGSATLWGVSCWAAGSCTAVGNDGLRVRYAGPA